MGGGHGSKLSVRPIVTAHHKTLVKAATGRTDRRALVELYALPAVAGAVYWWTSGEAFVPAASGALAAATGLLVGFMLQIAVGMYDRSAALADQAPERSDLLSEHVVLVGELAANASYAALVSLATTATLTTAALAKDWVADVASNASVVLLTHLVLLMLLVLRRVFLLGSRHRIETETGAYNDVE